MISVKPPSFELLQLLKLLYCMVTNFEISHHGPFWGPSLINWTTWHSGQKFCRFTKNVLVTKQKEKQTKRIFFRNSCQISPFFGQIFQLKFLSGIQPKVCVSTFFIPFEILYLQHFFAKDFQMMQRTYNSRFLQCLEFSR